MSDDDIIKFHKWSRHKRYLSNIKLRMLRPNNSPSDQLIDYGGYYEAPPQTLNSNLSQQIIQHKINTLENNNSIQNDTG